jgi:hypothetical protein
VNFRPEYSADWMRGSDYQQLPIRPLTRDDSGALLSALLGDDPANRELLERIRDETEGNPFFVEEVVQSLAESGALAGSRGAYTLAEPVASIAIPSSVRAVLAARIDRLSEDEKQVLQTAAVVGREVPARVLARVAGLSEASVDSTVGRLRRAEFLHEAAILPEVVYAFKHPLTQDVAYQSLLSERRISAHAAVAEALEELYADRPGERAALIAYHRAEAEQPMEAAGWYARAAVHLMNAGERRRCNHAALDLLKAVEGLGDPRVSRLVLRHCFGALISIWAFGGSRTEATDLLERARAAAAILDPEERGRLLSAVVMTHAHAALRWDPREAVESAREAFDLAERYGAESERLEARRVLVHVLWNTGGIQEAWDIAEPVIADPPADPLTRGEFLTTHPFLGLFRQASVARAALGHPREALEMNELALAWIRGDEGKAGLEAKLVGDELFDENYYQPHAWAVICCYFLGEGLRARRILEATRWNTEELHSVIGSPAMSAAAYRGHALALLTQEDWEALRTPGERLLDTQRLMDTPGWEALAMIARAEAGLGRTEVAIDRATQVLEGCGPDPTALQHASKALLMAGGAEHSERSRAGIDAFERVVRAVAARAWLPFVHEMRADLAVIRNDEATAERERAEAVRLWTEMDAPLHVERMDRDLAELRARQ